jgi:phosphoenolpyruvate-protein kinase (PTS system EI component)
MNETPETTTPQDEVTTPATETPQVDVAALQAKYERLQKDLAKYRTRADEVEASKKALEDEALKQKSLEEQIEALKTRASVAEQKATAAEIARVQAARQAALTGRVADPKAALRLIDDDHLTDDGDVNVDALLRAYPFLAPAQPARAGVTGANPTTLPMSKEPPKSLADAIRAKYT